MRTSPDASFVLGLSLIAFTPTALWAQDNPPGSTTTLPQSVSFVANETDVDLDPVGQPSIRVEKVFPFSDSKEIGQEIGIQFIDSAFSALGVDLGSICIEFDFGVDSFKYCLLDLIEDLSGSNPLDLPVAWDICVGGYFELQEVGGADVAITYPVDVTVEYPAANSFSCGDTIVIRTNCGALGGGDLTVSPPNVATQVGLIVDNLTFGADMEVCLDLPFDPLELGPICSPSVSLPIPAIDLPNLPPLFTICPDEFDGSAGSVFGCAQETNLLTAFIIGALDVDVDGTTGETCLFPGVLTQIPEMQVCFVPAKTDDLSYSSSGECQVDYVIDGSGTVEDIFSTSTDAVDWVDTVLCPSPVPILGCTSINLGSVVLDLGDIAPNFSIDQEMNFQFTDSRVYVDVEFMIPDGHGPVDYRVIDPSDSSIVESGVGTSVTVLAGHHVEIDFPEALRDPITSSQVFDLTANLDTTVMHHYFMGMDLALLELEIDGLLNEALVTEEVFSEELDDSPVTVQDATIVIDDFFETIPKSDFLLDPEDPVISVTRFELQDVVNLGDGLREVVYGIDIRNDGDVTLSDVGCDLDLGEIFANASGFAVTCVHSDQLLTNVAYDGSSDIDLLGPGNSLSVGEGATIDVLVLVEPEVAMIDVDGCFVPVEYSATTRARATSFIGTSIQSNVDECTGLPTADDIVVTVDLGAAVLDEIEDYALYAEKGVTLARAIELSRGNVGTDGTLMMVPLTAAQSADPRIIGDLHVGLDFHVNQSILEADYLQLAGALYQSADSILSLTGAASLGTECAAVFDVPSLPPMPLQPGASIVTGRDETVFVAPDYFENVQLSEGSTLVLSSGVYDFFQMKVSGDDVTLRFDDSLGPVTLNVGTWNMTSSKNVSILSNGEPGDSRNSFINYSGRKPLTFDGGTVVGTLIAPNTRVLFENCRLEGACYANAIVMGPFSSFTHHDYLDAVNIDPSCVDG